jgi:hypothetical protein
MSGAGDKAMDRVDEFIKRTHPQAKDRDMQLASAATGASYG